MGEVRDRRGRSGRRETGSVDRYSRARVRVKTTARYRGVDVPPVSRRFWYGLLSGLPWLQSRYQGIILFRGQSLKYKRKGRRWRWKGTFLCPDLNLWFTPSFVSYSVLPLTPCSLSPRPPSRP